MVYERFCRRPGCQIFFAIRTAGLISDDADEEEDDLLELVEDDEEWYPPIELNRLLSLPRGHMQYEIDEEFQAIAEDDEYELPSLVFTTRFQTKHRHSIL